MSLRLYEHNRRAYTAAVAMLEDMGKAAVIHPTGTGKSFIAFKLAESNIDSRICWLSPSEHIYNTQVENLKRAINNDSPKNITSMTYAKLMVSNDTYIDEIHPDYIILDEFHRCGATEWGKGINRLLKKYPEAKVLGLSATNIRYLDAQRDMAAELFDGNIASEITLGEAIARGILPAPTYITTVYSYERDLERYTKRAEKTRNPLVRDEASRLVESLRRSLEKADGLDIVFDRHITDRSGKFIVFCANLEHMHEMKDRVSEWFGKIDKNPRIYTLYSEDATSVAEFESFKADTSEHLKLLFCIDMLNEGVHVDDISGGILFRPTISPIIYKQQIGRALATGKNNQPLIFDIVNNIENLYSIGTITEEIEFALDKYGFDGEAIRERFKIIDETRDCRELFNRLQDTLGASWDVMYSAAKNYFNLHGDLLVPKKCRTYDGLSLGVWIMTQRRVKNKSIPGILTDARIEKLNNIGMVWDNLAEYSWEGSYHAAKLYYEKNGTLDVPSRYKTDDGLFLGSWICNLRHQRKSKSLNEERIKKLDAIGMIWDKVEHTWDIHFQAAKVFFEENGHLNVPVSYISGDGGESIKLGSWLRNQRAAYNKGRKAGTLLSKNKIKQLESIGMNWSTNFDHDWERGYSKAKEYYDEHGHLNVPANYKSSDGFSLGRWVRRHKSGATGRTSIKLTPERRERLSAIGMVWETKFDKEWEQNYEEAKEYFDKNGHMNVTATYKTPSGSALGY